jgi:hypothetical protein
VTSPSKPAPPAPAVPPTRESSPPPGKPRGGAPDTVEVGGPKGPEPTRYGDWERNGRCSDI